MKKWESYYEKTKNNSPHKNIVYFVENYMRYGNAIELGCGAGMDTIYLIKKQLECACN